MNGKTIALALGFIAAATTTQAATVDADTFNAALRKYGEGYYEYMVESDRCEAALTNKSPLSATYCASYEAAFKEREVQTRRVGQICVDMLNDMADKHLAATSNGYEVSAACGTFKRLTGRERYNELSKLFGR